MANERNRTNTLLEALQCSGSCYTIPTKSQLLPKALSYFRSWSREKNPGGRLLQRMCQAKKQTQSCFKIFTTARGWTVNNFAVFAYEEQQSSSTMQARMITM